MHRQAKLLSLLLTIGLASPLAAQAGNTGSSGWTVNVYNVAGNSWSGWYDAFVPASGRPGVWQPNDAMTSWISAWDDFSTTPGAGDYNHATDANARYHYLFRYTFSDPLSAGTLNFAAGWDNILKGIMASNGSSAAPSTYLDGTAPPRSVDSYFGFCRNGDAIYNTGNGTCSADFALPVATGAQWVQFEVWGDGQTDGMWLAWDQASIPDLPSETVPEPATMALLATGLTGLSLTSFRRRRKRPEA